MTLPQSRQSGLAWKSSERPVPESISYKLTSMALNPNGTVRVFDHRAACLHFLVQINFHFALPPLRALIDGGAETNCIGELLARKLGLPLHPLEASRLV